MVFGRNNVQENLWRQVRAVHKETFQPQQQHRHQLQHLPPHTHGWNIHSDLHPQLSQYEIKTCQKDQLLDYNSLSMATLPCNHCSTPLPPYSLNSCSTDCSSTGTAQEELFPERFQSDVSLTSLESRMSCADGHVPNLEQQGNFKRNGFLSENYGEVYVQGKTQKLHNNKHQETSIQEKIHQSQPLNAQKHTEMETFTANVINVLFRNCCGAGPQNNASNPTSPTESVNNNSIKEESIDNAYLIRKRFGEQLIRKRFGELMLILDKSQQSELLTAIGYLQKQTLTTTKCILVKRKQISDQDPSIIACWLFIWADLTNVMELKRSPICPNDHDSGSVCCNPLHWYRSIPIDTACSEYSESVENLVSSTTGSTPSASSMKKKIPRLSSQITGSLSTCGDGDASKSPSLDWCQIAYWKCKERVGKLYSAKKSPINIYSEHGCIDDGLSLNQLAERYPSKPTKGKEVHKKIGLGIILNEEADGVWLYNRSTEAIFVFSPSVKESFSKSLKVLPGYCLKAFDRTQNLEYSKYCRGRNMLLGPVDNYCIRISFVKGWGAGYTRSHITCCPCWVEVFLRR